MICYGRHQQPTACRRTSVRRTQRVLRPTFVAEHHRDTLSTKVTASAKTEVMESTPKGKGQPETAKTPTPEEEVSVVSGPSASAKGSAQSKRQAASAPADDMGETLQKFDDLIDAALQGKEVDSISQDSEEVLSFDQKERREALRCYARSMLNPFELARPDLLRKLSGHTLKVHARNSLQSVYTSKKLTSDQKMIIEEVFPPHDPKLVDTLDTTSRGFTNTLRSRRGKEHEDTSAS